MKLSRRNFVKTTAVSAASLSILGLAGCKKSTTENNAAQPAAQNTQSATAAAPKKASKTVVIAGGGYGGSTAAKYLKLLDPSVNVILIDRNADHVSCAMSNEVIFGLRDIKEITMPLNRLAEKYGIEFKQAEVTGLDGEKKILKTSAGDFAYDVLIVSPGISMDYDPALNFTAERQKEMPHAWIAGPQTMQLKDMVSKIKAGDTVIFRTPVALYRCPPGPYERACLYGNEALKKGAKVVVLDPNPQIMSKKPLFEAAFKDLYKDVLTYHSGVVVTGIDYDKKIVKTNKGDFQGTLINYVPDQKAGELVFTLGLVEPGKKWASVNPKYFESTLIKDVYVIGDAIDSGPVTEMPKSGTIANATAKVVVENLVRIFNGKEPKVPILGNTCYSLVSENEGIWIATLYEYDAAKNKIVTRNGANGIPKAASVENRLNGHSWGNNILSDTFM
ncbi:MAG TPA: FCSD flavin-binding domain-containing protein [Candidatus Mucispirillum faecigallinarum]|uniref:FCSD flavin-binding domain-containing protein n=1 Tax=Candidatus Mucispirillum faecigallinarum TaxID=2838699 RepID=A0A9D2GTP7_9BACT|nr:FCSD flavin-binding domain-containing protein [Candidatus Mucispirillum faecigallinarum]